MDLDQLRTVLQVAETGSLLRASEQLGIAQPALSRKVRQLEEELGLQIFVRHGRGMIATPFGERLIERARRVFAEIAELRNEAESLREAPFEVIAFGFPPNIAEFLAIPVLRRFKEKHPNVYIRLVSAFSGHLQEWLMKGDIDLALIYEQEFPKSISSQPLMYEQLFFVAPRERQLVSEVPFHFADLAKERLVLPSRRHRLREIVDNAARERGVALNIVHEADDLYSVRELITTGMACSVLTFPAIFAQVAEGIFSASPLIEPTLTRRLDLAFALQRPPTRLGKLLCTETLAELRYQLSRKAWGTIHIVDRMFEDRT